MEDDVSGLRFSKNWIVSPGGIAEAGENFLLRIVLDGKLEIFGHLEIFPYFLDLPPVTHTGLRIKPGQTRHREGNFRAGILR